MPKQYLNLLLLVVLVTSLKVEPLTKEELENFKMYPDNVNHFIIFHQPTLNELRSFIENWSSEAKAKFHFNNCKENKLPECEHPQKTPLLLMFNRVLIRFNGDPSNYQQMKQWITERAEKQAIFIHHEQELKKLLSQTSNIFCYCSNEKVMDEENVFHALPKTLPFLNYCVIRNGIYYESLGLKTGNLTYFKTNQTDRVEFTHPNRLDAWQWFIKANMLPTISRPNQLVNDRFAHKQKNIQAYVLTCDLSYTCEKTLQHIKNLQDQLNPEVLGYKFYLALQDKRQSFTFNLYYHLTFDMSQMPYFVHLSLSGNGSRAGDLVRHIQKTSKYFSLESLNQFKKDVEDKKIQPFFFSDKVPKTKSGFTGKGSEKLIQKLVAANIKEQIMKSPNHYVLLITALNIGCDKCDEFYKQFKQIASLLMEKDVTFGYLEANRNEIYLQQTVQLPDLFLFKKDDKQNPIRLDISHSFAHLRNFLRDNLGTAYSDPDQL